MKPAHGACFSFLRTASIALSMAIFFASACTDRESIPAGIMPADTVGIILRDIADADQLIADAVRKDSTKTSQSETIAWYNAIFRMHRTTREAFQHSLDFFESRPDLLKPVMDTLAARSNRDRTKFLDHAHPTHTDSVRRATADSLSKSHRPDHKLPNHDHAQADSLSKSHRSDPAPATRHRVLPGSEPAGAAPKKQ